MQRNVRLILVLSWLTLGLAGCQAFREGTFHTADDSNEASLADCSDIPYQSHHAVECAGSKEEREQAIKDEDRAQQNRAAHIRQDHFTAIPASH